MAETLRRVLSPGSGEEDAADAGPPLLLLGAPRSGKTSLLFAAALAAAGAGRGPVFFVTRRPLQRLPLSTRAALEPFRLQKVRFQYPPCTRELLRLLCSAHEAPGPAPSLLLLDGLEEYLAEDPGSQETAYLAALLLDTAAHFSHRLGSGGNCGLLVALETQEAGDGGHAPHLALLQRYFPARCWLHPQAPGPGQSNLHLRVGLESSTLDPREEWSVTFLPDGEMIIAPWPTQAANPSPDENSSTGDQSSTLACDSLPGPQSFSGDRC